MSSFRQPAGKPDASDTLTRLKAAVASVGLSWLVTASPARTGPPAPRRQRLLARFGPADTVGGNECSDLRASSCELHEPRAVPETELLVDTAPAAVRPWNAIPFAGVTKSDACAERASAAAGS